MGLILPGTELVEKNGWIVLFVFAVVLLFGLLLQMRIRITKMANYLDKKVNDGENFRMVLC